MRMLDENVKWLFLPDPNEPESSYFASGETFKVVYQCSPYLLDRKVFSEFEINLNLSSKATEIRLGDNPSVYDAELRHGLTQLQYALPQLFIDNIHGNLFGPLDANKPFIICPILVTTAELVLLDKSLSIKAVMDAEQLGEIGNTVPYLIMGLDCGPDFENHCLQEFKKLESIIQDEEVIHLIEKGVKNYQLERYGFSYPSFSKSLMGVERFITLEYFTQFFVCNKDALPDLINKIKNVVSRCLDSKVKIELQEK